MDIYPLIINLNIFKSELSDSILIAIGLRELNKADLYVAHHIAESKRELHSIYPFQQVANLYKIHRKKSYWEHKELYK